MIKLTIKIAGEKKTVTQREHLEDNFAISRDNPRLLKIVGDAVLNSNIQEVEKVILLALMEM